MNWYYSKEGSQHGPVTQQELQAKLQSGEVARDALVWREGMGDWLAANQLAEFAVAPASAGGAPYAPPVSQLGAGQFGTPPTYLWQAIVVTLFCCMPLGIPAIVFASKVDGLHARGDVQGSLDASRKAKMWCWWSFGIGLAFIGLYLLLMIVGATASVSGY
jgi:hypothetical protein